MPKVSDAFRSASGEGPLSTDVWFGWSTDGGATWRRAKLAGPFDLHTAKITNEGDFVGDYQGLVATTGGFVALYVLSDASLALLSLLQGLTFWWWRASRR